LSELVDLVAQRGDVLASLPERVAQLLVLRDRLGQLALGLEQTFLQRAHPLRGIGKPGAQMGDLLAQRVDLGSHGLAHLVGHDAPPFWSIWGRRYTRRTRCGRTTISGVYTTAGSGLVRSAHPLRIPSPPRGYRLPS